MVLRIIQLLNSSFIVLYIFFLVVYDFYMLRMGEISIFKCIYLEIIVYLIVFQVVIMDN